MERIKHSLYEVLVSVLPMAVLIIFLGVLVVPFPPGMMFQFIGGTIIMMAGLVLFLVGSDLSMREVGEQVGSYMVRRRNLSIFVGLAFIIGVVITIAEPDVQVLATQVESLTNGEIGKMLLTVVVGLGVGILLTIALVRLLVKVKLLYVLFAGYVLAFILAYFTNPSLAPIAFDSGGVTTGPLTVPFLLAIGSGVTSTIRPDKNDTQSFGIVGVASLGSIISVLILGVVFR